MKSLIFNFARMRLLASLGIAITTLSLLSGCASPARSDRMTVSSDFGQTSKTLANHSLKGNIGVATVTGAAREAHPPL